MDTNAIQVLNLVLTFGIACLYAYKAKKEAYQAQQNMETQRLVLENNKLTIENNRLTAVGTAVSESNAEALKHVTAIGESNAQAIEHTRVQNVQIAGQNDGIADRIDHVHTCVETRVAEVKQAVERVPEVVKEAVPAAVKEVVPETLKEVVPTALKEALPEAVAALKE